MALVDANYRFIYVDIGCNGQISDGGVCRNCTLNQKMKMKELPIPHCTLIDGTQTVFPFVIVADDAFLLKENLKPFHI